MSNWYESQINKRVVDNYYNKNYLINLNRIIHDRSADEVLLELFFELKDRITYLPIDMTKYMDRILAKYMETMDPYYLFILQADWSSKSADLIDRFADEDNPAVLVVHSNKMDADKEKLWEIIEEKKEFSLLNFQGIDWSDKKTRLWELFKETLDVGILTYSGVDWSDKKEELWEMANQPGKMFLLCNGGRGLNWSDKSEEIWQYAKNDLESIPWLSRREGINWSDKKEELWEIYERTGNPSVLDIGRNVDWSDKKKNIWDCYKRTMDPLLLIVTNIDWSDKKQEIWELFKQAHPRDISERKDWFREKEQKSKEVHRSEREELLNDYDTVRRRILYKSGTKEAYLRFSGLDWSDKKDELFEIACKTKDWPILAVNASKDIDFSDKKNEILRIFQEEKSSEILFYTGIDWSDKKDLIIDTYASIDSRFKEIVDNVRQKYNVTNDMTIVGDLSFNSIPFWKIEKKESDLQIKLKQEFLRSVLHRLNDLSVLKVLAESEVGALERIPVKYCVSKCNANLQGIMTGDKADKESSAGNYSNQIAHLFSSIDSFSPIELNLYLAFYINKLTKLNEVSIYEKALCGFEYDSSMEEAIDSGKTNQENEEYKNRRDKAQEKGDLLVQTFYALREEYNMISQRMAEKSDASTYPVIRRTEKMPSFDEFLLYWKSSLNHKTGEFKAKSQFELINDFYQHLNDGVKSLINEGIRVDDIINVFTYANNAMTFQNKLYMLKDIVLQQLIVYSQMQEFEHDIEIRYRRSKKSRKESGVFDDKTNDVLIVTTRGMQFPQSFHTNIDYFEGIDKGMEIASNSILSKYIQKANNYFIAPYTEKDMNVIFEELQIDPNISLRKAYRNSAIYQMLLLLNGGFDFSKEHYDDVLNDRGLKSPEALREETLSPEAPVTITSVVNAGNILQRGIANNNKDKGEMEDES